MSCFQTIDSTALQLFLYKENDNNHIDNRIIDIYSELAKHCNFLQDIQIKDELNSSFDFQFEKVIVLVRHGDRGPFRSVKNLNSLRCDNDINHFKNVNSDEHFFMNLVNIFVRSEYNLSKLNFSSYMTDLPHEKCVLGRLTKFGVSQHIKLGYLLSKTYFHRFNLTKTKAINSLKVYTTKTSRTFQSALSFLFGLFNQLNETFFYENLPDFIYSFDSYFCGVNESSQYCSLRCSKISILRNKLSLSNLLNTNKLASLNAVIENLSKIIAPNAELLPEYSSIISIFDGINAYLCHHEKLPCHPTYGCVLPSHVEDIFSYVCLIGKKFQNSYAYKHLSWLNIYGFLNNLIEEIYDASKFIIFFGHDITLESLKSVLGFHDCIIPPYASRMTFEVYSRTSKKYLRILYNGVDVTKQINNSNHLLKTNEGLYLIEVEKFRNYVREEFKFFTDTYDYKVACAND